MKRRKSGRLTLSGSNESHLNFCSLALPPVMVLIFKCYIIKKKKKKKTVAVASGEKTGLGFRSVSHALNIRLDHYLDILLHHRTHRKAEVMGSSQGI